MRTIPELETARLRLRRFVPDDLDAYYQIMKEIGWVNSQASDAENRAQIQSWLAWIVLNYDGLANLAQPPYGDRAVVLKATDELMGGCGLVPCLDHFGQLPYFGGLPNANKTAEVGLFWAIKPNHQQQGLATEVAQALIDYVFTHERLQRIVATTEYDNLASQAVMRKLGMRLERNPFPDPPWLQVVGILENTPGC